MAVRFTVLASGSSGNATLLEVDDFGLLIDFGLGPQVIAERLASVGSSWKAVSAVLMTHTHSDHWNAYTLAHLRGLKLPLIAHGRHHDELSARKSYTPLREAGLTRAFEAGRWFDVTPGVACLPVHVPHDADPTFAFRFQGPGWAIGYASDLGDTPRSLADAFAGVDLLALEFNHDVALQKASGRPRILIDRVLGSKGHLSNAQAATFAKQVAGTGTLKWLVQLHMSRDCNRADLAAREAQAVGGHTTVVAARQDRAIRPILLAPRTSVVSRPRGHFQPVLPGLHEP